MSVQRHLTQNDHLLHTGRYREWFWSNLDDKTKDYLKSPPVASATFKCVACKQTKPRIEFDKHQNGSNGYHRCNKCVLANPSKVEAARWESTNDDPDWFELSACSSVSPEIFFPENSYLANLPDAPWRAYCESCPVVQQCKNFAVASDSRGVFGGEFRPYVGRPDTKQAGPGRPRKVVT